MKLTDLQIENIWKAELQKHNQKHPIDLIIFFAIKKAVIQERKLNGLPND